MTAPQLRILAESPPPRMMKRRIDRVATEIDAVGCIEVVPETGFQVGLQHGGAQRHRALQAQAEAAADAVVIVEGDSREPVSLPVE